MACRLPDSLDHTPILCTAFSHRSINIRQVVDPISAIIPGNTNPGHKIYPMQRNHPDLVRFENSSDRDYRAISSCLRSMVSRSTEIAERLTNGVGYTVGDVLSTGCTKWHKSLSSVIVPP